MGQKFTTKATDPDIISAREHRSSTIEQAREKNFSIYNQMMWRILNKHSKSITPKLDFLNLPNEVILIIIKFLASDIRALMAVSPSWYIHIIDAFDEMFNPIESHFALVHSHLFAFNKSFLSSSGICVSERKGYRVDRAIVAEPLSTLEGKTIKFRYTYRTYQSEFIFKAEFKLDIIRYQKMSLWLHKDECRINANDSNKAYSKQIPEICIGDLFEFAINWYNLLGLTRLESIQWQPPIIQDTKAILKSIKLEPDFPRKKAENQGIKQKLYMYNISRHCEMELIQNDWYDARYYSKSNVSFDYNHFEPFLKLIKAEFAGVDVIVAKYTFKAVKEGIVLDAISRLGILIEVKLKEEVITNEVKRMGLLFDRHKPVQMRIGDILVVFISRGG
ncbi:unnamed protein product [Blepharisma stoltei]|uniref:F-box domain-containing protein n=1 Tax=Blepharisma stoltei TaxID=1481888 RepID=A0AAU9K0S6_9CILI|nr:unnamed protein product [Blepharisma stoltei]